MIKKSIRRWNEMFRTQPAKSKSGAKARMNGYFRVAVWSPLLLSLGFGIYWSVSYVQETERLEVRRVSVSGLHRVTENEVLASIGYAPGTHVLHVNLEETREAVEALLWVRHATIQRVWPNEIAISLVERQPIALARINSEIFQVDIEGVVLSPDVLTEIDAPILDGLHVGDPEGNEVKINIYKDIVEAIGESELSEVHVAESGEVSVVPTENPILIDLGLTRHRDRWEKYLGLSVRIHEDYPDAFRVDLRFRDQVIIQNKENEPDGNIIWGEETKLL